MGKYSEFLYEGTYVGGGDVYGFETILSSITDNSGPSTGGKGFVITGEGLTYTGYDDSWVNAALDSAKWSDISSGTGTLLTASPNLLLTTGSTSSSLAGVQSVDVFSNVQFETKVSIPSVSTYPDAEVVLFSFDLYVDSSNYSSLKVLQSANSSTTQLSVSVVVGGKSVDTDIISWTTGVSVFRILRFGSDVYFYANGLLMFKSKRFVSDNASIRYYSSNNSVSYNVSDVKVLYSVLKSFVVFGNQVVYDPLVVSAYRLRGNSPPSIDEKDRDSAFSGYVDISVVAGSTATQPNFYEYYFVDNLVILNSSQFNVKMNIIDDATVRTPSNEVKGLGGGK